MRISHLRRRAFPHRYGEGGNGGALYGLSSPITVAELRRLLEKEHTVKEGR